MSDAVNTPATDPAPAAWTVSGLQTRTADHGRSRVEIVIRGRVEGRVDRGTGVDQLRFAVWDDGQEMDAKVVDVPLGRSGVVTVRLGFEGEFSIVAEGVGIVITTGSDASGERVLDLDPFYPVVAP